MAKEKVKVENKTGIRELDAIIAATSNKFGTDLGGANYGNIEVFTTGSLIWDIALNAGGLPYGRIIEVIGEESALKTSFCLAAVAQAQRLRKLHGIDKRDLIIDLEHGMTQSFIEGFGIDLDLVIWERPDTVEQALQMCIDYPKSGFIDVVVFDSVDAGQNVRQQARNVGESDVGGISKDMNFAIRLISKIASKTGTCFLFINQVKMNPGAGMNRDPRTTPGGRALQYYASLRIRLLKRGPCKEVPGATLMRGKIIKTRLGPDYEQDINAAFIFGKGYSDIYDLNLVATSCGILTHSSGRTRACWNSESDGEFLHDEKGKQAAIDFIAANKYVQLRLRHACWRAGGVRGARTDADVLKEIKKKDRALYDSWYPLEEPVEEVAT